MGATLEGKTEWSRSERDECICCEGYHVYSYTLVDLDPPPPYVGTSPQQFNDAKDWLYSQICSAPEGARLRITVEVIE